jgi:hypothetical protein
MYDDEQDPKDKEIQNLSGLIAMELQVIKKNFAEVHLEIDKKIGTLQKKIETEMVTKHDLELLKVDVNHKVSTMETNVNHSVDKILAVANANKKEIDEIQGTFKWGARLIGGAIIVAVLTLVINVT